MNGKAAGYSYPAFTRGMTTERMRFTLSQHKQRPSFARFHPLQIQRAQGMPGNAGCWLHPRPPRGKVAQKRALTKQVQPRHPGIPCAVVYGLLRALPGEPACLPPSPCGASAPQDLAPAWARQNHTTSPSAKIAVRLTTSSRPPHPAPNVRDDAYAPQRGGTAGIIINF